MNGLGGGGGEGGGEALREPMDSNRSFPVMSILIIVLAALEIFRHMLDFRSSKSCLGLGSIPVVGQFGCPYLLVARL